MFTTQHRTMALDSLPTDALRFVGEWPAEDSLQDEDQALNRSRFDRKLLQEIPGIVWIADADLHVILLEGNALGSLVQAKRPQRETVAELFADVECSQDPERAHRQALAGLAASFEFFVDNQSFLARMEPYFDENGAFSGVIGVATDITESLLACAKQCEQRLAVEASRISSCLRTFAGSAAHNYNNLLTTILGFASLTRSRLPSDAPESYYLEQIAGAAEVAAELTRQVSLFAQRQPTHPEPVDLSALIVKMKQELTACLAPSVQLRLDAGKAVPPILADRAQLRSLILSLVFNASDAVGASDGLVTIRTQCVGATRAFLRETYFTTDVPEGDYVWLQVSDTGCGMDDETKAHVFEPFFSTKCLGRGLGLAAACGIVESHHGAIAVSSQWGLGTTFHVLLPVQEL